MIHAKNWRNLLLCTFDRWKMNHSNGVFSVFLMVCDDFIVLLSPLRKKNHFCKIISLKLLKQSFFVTMIHFDMLQEKSLIKSLSLEKKIILKGILNNRRVIKDVLLNFIKKINSKIYEFLKNLKYFLNVNFEHKIFPLS